MGSVLYQAFIQQISRLKVNKPFQHFSKYVVSLLASFLRRLPSLAWNLSPRSSNLLIRLVQASQLEYITDLLPLFTSSDKNYTWINNMEPAFAVTKAEQATGERSSHFCISCRFKATQSREDKWRRNSQLVSLNA